MAGRREKFGESVSRPVAENRAQIVFIVPQSLAQRAHWRCTIEEHLKQRYGELFGACFDVLLYDLTSTYVEGAGQEGCCSAGIRGITDRTASNW